MPPCANAVDVHRAHVGTSSSPGRSLRFTTYSFQRKYLGGGRALATASHNCIPRITRRVLSHPNKRVYPGMDRLRHLAEGEFREAIRVDPSEVVIKGEAKGPHLNNGHGH